MLWMNYLDPSEDVSQVSMRIYTESKWMIEPFEMTIVQDGKVDSMLRHRFRFQPSIHDIHYSCITTISDGTYLRPLPHHS